MAVSEDLKVQVIAETGQAQQALSGFGGAIQQFASTLGGGGLFGGIAQGIGSIVSAAAPLAGVAAVGYGIHEAFQMVAESVQETVKWNLEAGKLGRQLGTTTEDASILANTLEDNGIAVGTYTRAVGFMVRALNSGSPAFAQLGVATRDSNGDLRSSNEIFVDVIDKLRQIDNPTKQAQIGMQLLGRSWMEAREILRINSETLEKTKKQMEDLGTVVTPQTEAASRQFSLALADVKDVIQAFGINVGNKLIPVLTELLEWLADRGTVAVGAFRAGLDLLGRAFDFVAGIVTPMAQAVGDLVSILLELGGDILKELGTSFDAVFGGMPSATELAGDAIRSLAAIFVTIVGVIEVAGQTVIGFFRFIKDGVFGVVSAIPNIIQGNYGAAFNQLKATDALMAEDVAQTTSKIAAAWERTNERVAKLSKVRIADPLNDPTANDTDKGDTRPKGRTIGDVGKDTSGERLKAWKTELDEIKSLRENWFTFDNQRELEFWQSKLGSTRRGTAAYKGVLSEIVKLQKDINKESTAEQEAQIRREMDARSRADDAAIAEIHESTKRKMEAAKQSSALGQQKAKDELDIEAISADESQKTAIQLRGIQQQAAAEEALAAELARLRQEDVRLTIAAERMKLEARLSSLDQLRALHATDEKFQEKITDDQTKLVQEAAKRETQMKDAELLAQQRDFGEAEKRKQQLQTAASKAMAADQQRTARQIESYLDPFVQGFSDGLKKILNGTLSLGDAVKGMGKMLVTALGDAIGKMVTDWIAGLARIAAQWIAQQFAMLFATQAVEKGKSSAALESAGTVVPAKAAEAGAGAAASAAATPFIGWLIAIPVMIGIVAAVMGLLGGMKSAAGGFDIPSGLNPMTQLHAEEMVLPAPLANAVRGMAGGGARSGSSSGGTVQNIHISTMDRQSFSQALRQHGSSLRKELLGQVRDGKMGRIGGGGRRRG